MKKIYCYLCYLCCFFLMFSCSSNVNSHKSDLLKAEGWLMTNPDSTLYYLSKVLDPNKLKGKEQAKYNLLYSAAKFRKYEHQSDSMILIAVNYYEKNGSPEELAEAYFYIGGIAEDLKDLPRAQNYFLKALDAGRKLTDYSLLGKISSNIGTIYTSQDMYNEALKYQRMSLDYFKTAKDTVRIPLSLRNIGRVLYLMYNTPDSAIAYYEQAMSIAYKVQKVSMSSELAGFYKEKKDYDNAYKYMQYSLQNEEPDYDRLRTYYSYGKLLYDTGELDSAQYYFNKSIKIDSVGALEAYYYLAKINLVNKQYDKCISLQNKYISSLWDKEKKNNAETIIRMSNMYNYNHAEIEMEKANRKSANRQTVIVVCIALILVLGIMIIAGYAYIKKKKFEMVLQQQKFKEWKKEQERNSTRQLERNKLYISKLEEELSSKQVSIDNLEKLKTEKAFIEAENRKIEFKSKEQQVFVQELKNSDIYLKVHSDDVKITETEWNELFAEINKAYPLFESNLRSLSNISDLEFKVCCLIKMEVPIKNIAFILNKARQTITTIRSRLYEKINGVKGTTKDFDDFILSL